MTRTRIWILTLTLTLCGYVFGEVELRSVSSETECGLVVSKGSGLGGLERAEPDAGRTVRVADLGRPFAPRPLPDPTVSPSGWQRGGRCGWWLRRRELRRWQLNGLSWSCRERERICVRNRALELSY